MFKNLIGNKEKTNETHHAAAGGISGSGESLMPESPLVGQNAMLHFRALRKAGFDITIVTSGEGISVRSRFTLHGDPNVAWGKTVGLMVENKEARESDIPSLQQTFKLAMRNLDTGEL